MTTLSDSAEEQLSRSIRRRYRERAGAFAWLAFAIDHADVIEAHDRVDASIKQAPIFLAHLERWRQTTRRLASALDLNQLISLVATAQRSPIAESANVCDAIDHTMASIIDLPVLSELRETQEKMSCTLRDIRSAVAD